MKPSDLVKVKALEWRMWRSYHGTMTFYYDPNGTDEHMMGCRTVYVADGVSGVKYHICRRSKHGRISSKYFLAATTPIHRHPITWNRLSDAKAACQAHYESMIYELLEVR